MVTMSGWSVIIPHRSNRRPILKPRPPPTFYPERGDTLCTRCKTETSVDLRPHSSTGYHRLRSPLVTIHTDRQDSGQPSLLFGSSQAVRKATPLTYVPKLKSWVSNAVTDYEKSTAYQIQANMNRGFTPRSRSMSPSKTRPYFGRSLSHADGFGYPSQYALPWNSHGATFNMASSHMQGASPMVNYTMYPQTARQSRPTTRHMRRGSLTKDYVHDLSCFQSTQPMVSGHFVIHPDWVSERMTPRKQTPRKAQIQY